MRNRLIIIVIFIGLSGLFLWQLPALLRLVPSRYLAAYAPEAIQSLAVSEQAAVLPTAQSQADTATLLGEFPSATASVPTATPLPMPATPTVAAHQSEAVAESPTTTATKSLPTVTLIPTLPTPPPAARIDGITHHFQGWNNCGPATLAMALSHFDLFLNQDDTAAVLKPNPEDRNVSPAELASYVNNETPYSATSRANGNLDQLRQFIASGMPVIIEIGIDPPGDYAWMEWYGHYLLVVAYDDANAQIWTYDSWFGTSEVPGENATTEGRAVSYAELEEYWRHFNWNYVVLYAPEQVDTVATIIGDEINDQVMWQRNLEEVQEALRAEPNDPYLWFNLGTIYNALSDYERAATAFDKSREIGLPWRMLWYQFGPYEAYYETGRYEEVILLADITLKDRPYFEEAFYYKGLAQAALGDTEAAIRSLRRSAEFNPNFLPAAAALEAIEQGN